jgi:type VI secretion system protein ImpK
MALVFQEVLTVVVRLRSNRQAVHDAESFRQHVRQALRQADQEARKLGYVEEDIRLAIFATVAFLDESILNLQSPVFADWVRKPLQEELFGRHTAGEIFFQQLEQLLGKRETPELADLLEVFQLCLLLGFVGRYSISGRGELKAVIEQTGEKIQRIRGPQGDLSPGWKLPEQRFEQGSKDRWVKRMVWIAACTAGVALALFLLYKVLLVSGLSALGTLVR